MPTHGGTALYDLIVIGAGSGNMVLSEQMSDWRVAVIESDRFGGTCLNRGCIPTKMFVLTADVAQTVRHASRYGVAASLAGVDWPMVRDRIFGRIDPLHADALRYRRSQGVDVYLEECHFIGHKHLQVGQTLITGEQIVLADGSRPSLPDLPGLDQVDYLTSDDVMRLEALPKSMLVLGGGYVAAEMSHIFGAFGVQVSIVERGSALLARHDRDVSAAFTEAYRSRFDLHLDTTATAVSPTRAGVRLELSGPGSSGTLEAEALLVATGRVPNSDRLRVQACGIEVDSHGHVLTDSSYQTNVAGVWSLGDAANHFQLKHMANAEARLVSHNLLHPDHPQASSFSVVPSAVFAEPQVASVGLTQRQLEEQGKSFLSSTRYYRDTAYGWALEDTTGFVKVLADPETRQVLGAHIFGPQASILIQPLVQAMCLGNTLDEVARAVLYIHPALSEAVEQALLEL